MPRTWTLAERWRWTMYPWCHSSPVLSAWNLNDLIFKTSETSWPHHLFQILLWFTATERHQASHLSLSFCKVEETRQEDYLRDNIAAVRKGRKKKQERTKEGKRKSHFWCLLLRSLMWTTRTWLPFATEKPESASPKLMVFMELLDGRCYQAASHSLWGL